MDGNGSAHRAAVDHAAVVPIAPIQVKANVISGHAAADEAVELGRVVEPRFWITYALYWQSRVAQARGDFALAKAAVDEGVAKALEDGFNQPIAHLATMRGRFALAEADQAGALRWFAVALPALRRLRNHWSTIMVLEDLAQISAAQGDAEPAARLLRAAANLRDQAGARALPAEREALDRISESARANLDGSRFDAAFQAGRALGLGEMFDLAETMVAF